MRLCRCVAACETVISPGPAEVRAGGGRGPPPPAATPAPATPTIAAGLCLICNAEQAGQLGADYEITLLPPGHLDNVYHKCVALPGSLTG